MIDRLITMFRMLSTRPSMNMRNCASDIVKRNVWEMRAPEISTGIVRSHLRHLEAGHREVLQHRIVDAMRSPPPIV